MPIMLEIGHQRFELSDSADITKLLRALRGAKELQWVGSVESCKAEFVRVRPARVEIRLMARDEIMNAADYNRLSRKKASAAQ